MGFAAVALFYAAIMARGRVDWMLAISGPLQVTSLLFLWSAKRKRQGHRGFYRLPH